MALTIAFCYDRKSDYSAQGLSEEELSELDSDITIDEISKAISQLGHTIIHVGNIKSLVKLLAANEKPKWDLVFNITEVLFFLFFFLSSFLLFPLFSKFILRVYMELQERHKYQHCWRLIKFLSLSQMLPLFRFALTKQKQRFLYYFFLYCKPI